MSDPASPPAQSPLNLIIPLRPPIGPNTRRLSDILKQRVRTYALNRIGIVHFGRFFVMDGKFMLFTTFDGKISDYILDFAMDPDVSALFNIILEFSQDKDGVPLPLPVQEHPHEFVDFVERHCERELIWFSGYRDQTVESIHNADQWRRAGRALVPEVQGFATGGGKAKDARKALKDYLRAVAKPTPKQFPSEAPSPNPDSSSS